MEEFKKIVALSFIKAKKDNPLAGSKTALAKKISKRITKNEKEGENERHYKTLSNYYDFFFKNGAKQEPTETIINKLLAYLNYDSTDQFLKNQPIDDSYLKEVPFVDYKTEIGSDEELTNEIDWDPPERTDPQGVGWKKIVITISFIPLIAAIVFWGIDWKQNGCMTWSKDHYIVIECGKTNSPDIALNPDLLENFRKIELDSTMKLFENGKGIYWYSKYDRKIEYFTMGGKHPTNGKTLKRISQPIVRKYIYGEE
ncbi:hypothetical protein IWQ47_001283 [Aquimarina sp. EL_43]|uniref:hypothetical protein n=1 Tax=unclassified Aquimarina TaxID=2627091 RepID=UPI0018CA1657|nr:MULTISPECIES: hypothetical protein [unclassified Aquimarina]MBG6129414.1 hypothetical protein [Aquimarina sp. EL_35]MBG6150479.1 hypothetical protein [Aquimarina sp. EL_32]MBG6168213.1 hypothetical protein [Aquimarina sp. EL_43]